MGGAGREDGWESDEDLAYLKIHGATRVKRGHVEVSRCVSGSAGARLRRGERGDARGRTAVARKFPRWQRLQFRGSVEPQAD